MKRSAHAAHPFLRRWQYNFVKCLYETSADPAQSSTLTSPPERPITVNCQQCIVISNNLATESAWFHRGIRLRHNRKCRGGDRHVVPRRFDINSLQNMYMSSQLYFYRKFPLKDREVRFNLAATCSANQVLAPNLHRVTSGPPAALM